MQKAAPRAAFFCFHSISTEYQVETIRPPNIFGGFGGEAMWNQHLLPWCGAVGLDSFAEAGMGPPACDGFGLGTWGAKTCRFGS